MKERGNDSRGYVSRRGGGGVTVKREIWTTEWDMGNRVRYILCSSMWERVIIRKREKEKERSYLTKTRRREGKKIRNVSKEKIWSECRIGQRQCRCLQINNAVKTRNTIILKNLHTYFLRWWLSSKLCIVRCIIFDDFTEAGKWKMEDGRWN